ncbi:hypothetical protein ABT267_16920, partial [Nonomuraea sp. NPDC001023]
PDQTVSVMRPKGPFPPAPEPGGGRPPQRPDDEGTVTTRHIAAPRSGSPGQQVYPPAQQPPHAARQQGPGPQGAGQQGAGQQGPGQGGPQQGGPGQGRPVPPAGGPHQGQGLGTDLFAIAGPPEKPQAGNRNGMLVLMAVAAAAAVVIAVLIVALISS